MRRRSISSACCRQHPTTWPPCARSTTLPLDVPSAAALRRRHPPRAPKTPSRSGIGPTIGPARWRSAKHGSPGSPPIECGVSRSPDASSTPMPLPLSADLAARHVRVRRAMDVLSLDALIVTAPANIRYLTNHTGTAGIAVVTAEAIHLLIDFRYEEAVRELQGSTAACPTLAPWRVTASYDEALLQCLIAIGVTAVGFEAGHLTVARHDWLVRSAGSRAQGLRFRATERVVEELRLVKDAGEIAALRESARRLGPVADAAFRHARAGMAERAVAAAIEAAMREAGYERPAFDTIVASGPNAALPHYRAGDRILQAGDVVVLDFGGVLDGYCCDLTRTISVGSPSTVGLRVHAAVLAAQQAE